MTPGQQLAETVQLNVTSELGTFKQDRCLMTSLRPFFLLRHTTTLGSRAQTPHSGLATFHFKILKPHNFI